MDIEKAILLFIESLTKKGFSSATIETRATALKAFLNYCKKHKAKNVQELSFVFLQRYMAFVFTRTREDKKAKLSRSRQRVLLISLKLFMRFCYDKALVLNNPIEKIKIPLAGRTLPSSFLSEEQIKKILKAVKIRGELGIRDIAILEVLYSCGIRKKEICHLKIDDIDLQKENLWIKATKTNKDRIIPIAKSALKRLVYYLEKERPRLARRLQGKDERFVFLSRRGTPLSLVSMGEVVRKYRIKAGIKTKGACHLFRHAMASHMLKNGADIRYIQEMLGHSSVSTTEIYTKVEITNLQKQYEQVFG